MISPLVLVLLVIYGSHISAWLPVSNRHALKAHAVPGHIIIILSLYILGHGGEGLSKPLATQILAILSCWVLILMFTRTGKYASMVALFVMVSHQVVTRHLHGWRFLQSCLEAMLVLVLATSFVYEYATAQASVSPITFLFGRKENILKA